MKKLPSDGYMLPLRLPDGMREVIQEAAVANRRTMTGEIVARLESSFANEPQKPAVRLNDLEARLATFRIANDLDSIRGCAKRPNSESWS